MARGLLHGASITLVIGFLFLFFAVLSPMWLVVRTELEISQCWFGEGIFYTNFWWGSDLDKAHFKCQGSATSGFSSTFDAYCTSTTTNEKLELCSSMKWAKLLSILALLSSGIGLVCCFLLDWKRRLLLQGAVFFSITSFGLALGITLVMFYSPLFSNSHIAHLNKQFNTGPNVLQLFSCSLQSLVKLEYFPFFWGSAPMECAFPGPSAMSMLMFFIAQGLGTGFLVVLKRDDDNRQSLPIHRVTLQQEEEEHHDDVLPASFHTVRRYSLNGAMNRRFSKMRPIRKNCLLTVTPVCAILSNALTWAGFLLLGIQIVVNVHISIVDNSSISLSTYRAMSWWQEDSNQSLPLFSTHTSLRGLVIFDDIINGFNFSPLTSLYFFWTIHAKLIFYAVFIAVVFLPIAKVLCWIWFFYVPVQEIFRGRVLMYVDILGKYSLANLYIMLLITIGLTFNSNFIVFPLSLNESLLVKVRAGISAGNGWGSYLFAITSILSLLIGQVMVQLHAFASGWEEERRSRLGEEISLRSPAYSALDTPMDSNRPLLGEGEIDPNRRSTAPPKDEDIVRALAKFGSHAALDVLNRQLHETHRRRQEEEERAAEIDAASREDYVVLVSPPQRPATRLLRHAYMEAMCDRVHTPIRGVQLKFTPCGKIFLWFLIFFVSAIMLICQSLPLFEIHKYGFTGDWIVTARDRYQTYTLLSLTSATLDMGYQVPALELSVLFFTMTCVMPIVTVWGLVMLWGIPLSLSRQELLFNWLEIASAWSSLDIFLISLLIMSVEVQNVISNIISSAVPQLSTLLQIFLPWEDGLMNAKFDLKYGVGVLCCAVLAEKIALYLVTENAVQSISERRMERFLGALKRNNNTLDDDDDATERLLESDVILAFAPGGRYVSALFPHHIYAGLPRSWWSKSMVYWGLLADAETMNCFEATGQLFPPPVEEEVNHMHTTASSWLEADQLDRTHTTSLHEMEENPTSSRPLYF